MVHSVLARKRNEWGIYRDLLSLLTGEGLNLAAKARLYSVCLRSAINVRRYSFAT